MKSGAGAQVEDLPQNAEWFRLLFERSADTMTLLDPVSLKFIDGNEAFARAAGISRAQIPHISPVELAPEYQPDGRTSKEVARQIIELTMKNGSHRHEWLTRRADGELEFIDVVSTNLTYGGRQMIFTTARNIDAVKKIETDLRVSEARWRRVFDQAPMSMQIFSPDGASRETNAAFGELFSPILDLVPGFNIREDTQLKAAGMADVIERAFQGEVVVIPSIPFELKVGSSQGKGTRWIGSTMFPVFDAENRILEVVCVHEDNTARKDAEAEVRQLNQSLEQRIAERTLELRLSEERFKQLFDFSPLGMARVDEQGLFHHVNKAFATLVGYTPGELVGRNYWEITNPSFYSPGCNTFAGLGENGRFGPFDKEYLHRDGRGVPVRLNGVQVVSSTGDAQIWTIAEDISQRHEAERALRESEEKFKALFELSPLGMARVDWDGRLLQVNESFAGMIGYTVEEATGLSYWDITPTKYEEQELLILKLVQQHGRFGPFEKEYIHRDGHLVPIVINGMMIRGPEGKDELWGIVEDVTQRRRAEQTIRESEKKFRTLFESSSQGVMLHDEHNFFSDVNPAAAELFGLSQEEIVGKHPIDLAPEFQPGGERSADMAKREIEKCLTRGTARFEWEHLNATGRRIFLEVVLSRIPNEGKYLMQAVVTDISDRKRVEQEFKVALERERELNQLKSNFVSMVSHEFRTPLGIIQSSAEILDDYLELLDPDERAEQLQSIIKNSRRMAGLMEDVLLLGRLDSGRMEFLPRPLDLAALCRRLVDEVRSTTEARCPIEFSTADLPREAMADERLLRHILLNLLTNAVKYSERGQPVAFRAGGTPDSLVFIVRDQGIGIPDEHLPVLFEAFRRGSNVGQTPGTGLGLVIVKQSVELHRGTVEVASRQGLGTAFTVTIPLTPHS